MEGQKARGWWEEGKVRAQVIWHVNRMVVGSKSLAHWLAETQPVEPVFGLSALSDMLIPRTASEFATAMFRL